MEVLWRCLNLFDVYGACGYIQQVKTSVSIDPKPQNLWYFV